MEGHKDSRRLFTWRQRLSLLRRAGFRCEKCGVSVLNASFHAHHIEAHSAGGATELDNGMIVCESCHKEIHRGV